MTETVCLEKNPANFLNFPSGTNGTFLMNIICRPIRTVESALSLNLTDVESDALLSFQNQNFNWTLFNEKIVKIYHYIDSLVHQEDQGNITFLNDAAEKFKEAWTDRVTARDAWEARFVFSKYLNSSISLKRFFLPKTDFFVDLDLFLHYILDTISDFLHKKTNFCLFLITFNTIFYYL